ncbi:MAG: ParB/RepB/Spo0J family partition protein [Odoribacteraceae bacterium]|jgi:ParB family chromosome partitioning protein|nr:ParB/RepB/Spo0J family partition protein [Odoribacteraceae bacterium]
MGKKSALGRGLGALLEDAGRESKSRGEASTTSQEELSLEAIRPNPNQPRKSFDEEALRELAISIKSIGLVQPITVREVQEGEYEIIAGERRYRAAKMAGLTTIPAYIRKVEERSVHEMALIENIQRENLNPVEEALGYQRLIDECDLTQDALSERVGKNRATIANYLRLLRLPAPVQLALKERAITMGHAKALMGIEDPETQQMIFEQILKFDFSVRKVEEVVRELSNPKEPEVPVEPPKAENPKVPAADYTELQVHLSRCFNTKVGLKRNEAGRGKIEIAFTSDSELERILGLLDRLND